MSTAGQILVGLSGITSGSAADHLLGVSRREVHIGAALTAEADQLVLEADAEDILTADCDDVGQVADVVEEFLAADAVVEVLEAEVEQSLTVEA